MSMREPIPSFDTYPSARHTLVGGICLLVEFTREMVYGEGDFYPESAHNNCPGNSLYRMFRIIIYPAIWVVPIQ